MRDLITTYFILYFLIYFIPTVIALVSKNNRVGAVFVINLFLGWTFIGWVWALVWAVSPKQQQQSVIINNHVSADRTVNPIIAQPTNDNFQNIQAAPKQTAQIEMTKAQSHQDKISQLKQLKELLDAGILTQEEFEQQKDQILAL
jgi:hypothetical protein